MLFRFDFFSNKRKTIFLWWGRGGGADFFQQLELDFIDQLIKVYFFVTIKSFQRLLLAPIHLFNFSFIQ